MVETPLNNELRIVHLASGIASAYCTKLLVDGGATAVRIEAPGGDPLRRRAASGGSGDPGLGGALFQYLAASTQSVTVNVEDQHDRSVAWSLIENADAVMWNP